MNIQHSSRLDGWLTPLPIIEMVWGVMGGIDLDPTSSYQGNKRVKAGMYFDEAMDGLMMDWVIPTKYPAYENFRTCSVYCNPPGGKRGNKSLTHLFWQKLMQERVIGNVHEAIFMFFSVEGLAVSQGRDTPAATQFPCCIPRKRIKFDHPTETKSAPSHSNAIVYVPGIIGTDNTDKFVDLFSSLGDVMVPYKKAA